VLLRTEPGGHRWQRVPPNERRGRVHTSTVTVAILDEPARVDDVMEPRDVAMDTYSGSGPGGQHRNKTANCVRAVHTPTGIEAKSESERSLEQNRRIAMATLAARVRAFRQATLQAERARERRGQVGSGERGDKVRTVRAQDGVVTCERTGRRARLRDYLRGDLSWLG
jgi:peptide chain release factor 1